jgi:hypothetical protein
MNATRTLFLATLGVAILSGQGKAPPGPPKIQVLIITGQNGHDWRGTTPVLKKELEDTGKFEVRVNEEFRGAGPETLAPYDVVVVNYMERGQAQLRWGERADNAFLDYVRSGKGVVLYHFTLAAFTGWTEFEKMSAGNWRAGNGHHSARHDFTHGGYQGCQSPDPERADDTASGSKRGVVFQPEMAAGGHLSRAGHRV